MRRTNCVSQPCEPSPKRTLGSTARLQPDHQELCHRAERWRTAAILSVWPARLAGICTDLAEFTRPEWRCDLRLQAALRSSRAYDVAKRRAKSDAETRSQLPLP